MSVSVSRLSLMEISQMSKTSNFTIALFALAGAAFSQDMSRILARDTDTNAQRGSLLRQNNPGAVPADTQRQLSDQLRADNQTAHYKRGELIHQQLYHTRRVWKRRTRSGTQTHTIARTKRTYRTTMQAWRPRSKSPSRPVQPKRHGH